jgi:hypothetical protein
VGILPQQFIAGIEFDRSPGSAASIGPTNFGRSINLLLRSVPYAMGIRATASYGSFNTRIPSRPAGFPLRRTAAPCRFPPRQLVLQLGVVSRNPAQAAPSGAGIGRAFVRIEIV